MITQSKKGKEMKKALIIAGICLPTMLYAQQVNQPVATPVTPPVEYSLKVTSTELDLISDGLQSQPFGKVLPLMNKLRQQVLDQQPKEKAPELVPGK